MATSAAQATKFTDSHLSCRICLNVFQTPKTLHCLHSFCRDCLQQWIANKTDAYNKRGYTCPVCRQFVTVKNLTSGWADDIPTDFRLQAMVEDVAVQHGSVDETTRLRVKIPARHRNFEPCKTIEATSSSDTNKPRLLDIVVLFQKDTDVIVVCDQINACVKAFWFDVANNKEEKSEMSVNDKKHFPVRVGKIHEKNVAVSLYKTMQILVLNVGPKLTLNRTIDLESPCWCLCVVESETSSRTETRLAVSASTMDLSVVDMDGVTVTHMNVTFSGNYYLKVPHYLHASPSGDVIVSDFGANSLVCVNQEKKVLWKHKLDGPGGVCCDQEGFIYFADYKNNAVGLLSPSGKVVKTVLSAGDDVKWPTSVYYDKLGDRLFVSQSGGLIRIFKQIT